MSPNSNSMSAWERVEASMNSPGVGVVGLKQHTQWLHSEIMDMMGNAPHLLSMSEINAGGTGELAGIVEVESSSIKTFSHLEIMDMMKKAPRLLSMNEINTGGTGLLAEVISPTIH